MSAEMVAICRSIMERHSRSFSFASAQFPGRIRDDAAVVYAFCRQADDAVDGVEDPRAAADALSCLRARLRRVATGDDADLDVVSAFAEVMRRRRIPLSVALDLLDGMEMDLQRFSYETIDELLLYCYRAAGTVGLMMAMVMGVSSPAGLARAAHLGIAMQLTNICRDVLEDWGRGRLYLPLSWLDGAGCGHLQGRVGRTFPAEAAPGTAIVVRQLLALADRYYASGDRGLPLLPWRCAMAVRTARLVYSAIGLELARVGHDVRAGRAVVPFSRKLRLLAGSTLRAVLELPARLVRRALPWRAGVIDGPELGRL
jgi:phytoene synthase